MKAFASYTPWSLDLETWQVRRIQLQRTWLWLRSWDHWYLWGLLVSLCTWWYLDSLGMSRIFICSRCLLRRLKEIKETDGSSWLASEVPESESVLQDLSTPAICSECPEGLTCPLLSKVEDLKAGTSALGSKYVPQAGLHYVAFEMNGQLWLVKIWESVSVFSKSPDHWKL